MADVAVENPANNVTLHNKPAPLDTIPNIDSLEGTGSDGGDEYATLKRLQRHLEYVLLGSISAGLAWWLFNTDHFLRRYIQLQEEYIKDEQR